MNWLVINTYAIVGQMLVKCASSFIKDCNKTQESDFRCICMQLWHHLVKTVSWPDDIQSMCYSTNLCWNKLAFQLYTAFKISRTSTWVQWRPSVFCHLSSINTDFPETAAWIQAKFLWAGHYLPYLHPIFAFFTNFFFTKIYGSLWKQKF